MITKSIFPDSMLQSSQELTLESIATKLTTFTEQLHLLHWQTQSYAEHMCLGSLYDYIHDFKDEVIEKLMGYVGRRAGAYRMEPLMATSSSIVVSDIILFANELKRYAETNNYLDIGNMADALSGEAAKSKYLLTLS
jgi:hypothetical protein